MLHVKDFVEVYYLSNNKTPREMAERMMSICFTWFPIGWFKKTQYITSIGLNYKNVGRVWRVSDCEELVGATHRR